MEIKKACSEHKHNNEKNDDNNKEMHCIALHVYLQIEMVGGLKTRESPKKPLAFKKVLFNSCYYRCSKQKQKIRRQDIF